MNKIAENDILLEEQDGHIYIKIPANKDVGYSEVTRMVKSLDTQDVDYASLKRAYTTARGESVRIGSKGKDSFPQRESSRIEVEISPDGRDAYIILKQNRGGKPFTYREIMHSLKSRGVTRGYITENIKMAAATPPKEKVKAAEWIPPINGMDAELTYHFPEYRDLLPFLLERNQETPFEKINFIHRVKMGDLIISKAPVVKGVPGCKVTGEKVPSQDGRDVVLEGSEHLTVSPDGAMAFAARDGQVVIDNEGRVAVRPLLVLNKTSGDKEIKFNGSILIEGDLGYCPGIIASGDVEINGGNQNVPIRAENVFIKGPFLLSGKPKGLTASKDLACITTNSTHIAARNIYVHKEANKAILEAEEEVHTSTKEGKTIGGEIRAGKRAVLGELGNKKETETLVRVATGEIQRKYNDLKKEKAEKRLEKLKVKSESAQEAYLKLDKERMALEGKKLHPELEEKVRLCKEQKESLQTEVDNLKIELVRCKSFKPDNNLGEVLCQKVYSGVRIEMGESFREIKVPIESPVRFLKRAVGIITEMKDTVAKKEKKEEGETEELGSVDSE